MVLYTKTVQHSVHTFATLRQMGRFAVATLRVKHFAQRGFEFFLWRRGAIHARPLVPRRGITPTVARIDGEFFDANPIDYSHFSIDRHHNHAGISRRFYPAIFYPC